MWLVRVALPWACFGMEVTGFGDRLCFDRVQFGPQGVHLQRGGGGGHRCLPFRGAWSAAGQEGSVVRHGALLRVASVPVLPVAAGQPEGLGVMQPARPGCPGPSGPGTKA
jgi:hypothetical protein